jgi:poly-beta-1,6-N-acetyl-D-glucosamine synthase
LILLLILFTPVYAGLLFWCLYGLSNIEDPDKRAVTTNLGLISVIIPFRNEAEHILKLVDDIHAQDIANDRFEVIWVDDHSEDDSRQLIVDAISGFSNHRVLSLNSGLQGKKQALKYGIESASGSVIVTTDADCRVPQTWLSSIANAFYLQKAEMLILPLSVSKAAGAAESFQQLENFAIQGIAFGMAANGMPVSCNGANLAFSRKAFDSVGGYNENRGIASGDDLFLLSAFLKAGKKVAYYWDKKVLANTLPQPTWRKTIEQRMRWAGKMTSVKLFPALIVGAILLLHALLIYFNTFWLIVDVEHLNSLLAVIGVRVAIDALLIKTVASRYGQSLNPLKLTIVSAFYWMYLPWMALASKLQKVSWKGRAI